LLGETGLLSQNIKVGSPGSSRTYNEATWVNVIHTLLSQDFDGFSPSKAPKLNDIGFLVLLKNFPLAEKIYLASESQLLALQSNSAPVRIIGYGVQDSLGFSNQYPRFFDGNLNRTYSYSWPDPNSMSLSSSQGAICNGDSGGPVISITPLRVQIIGVITASARGDGRCTTRGADGKFYASFTLVNHFADIAMTAQAMALDWEIKLRESAVTLASANQKDANQKLVESQEKRELQEGQLDYANSTLADAESVIAAYKATGMKLLTCKSPKQKLKRVAALKPKCPKGYSITVG
jgi:hypothetical protein